MSTAIDSIEGWLLRMLCERAPGGIVWHRRPKSLCLFCTPLPAEMARLYPASLAVAIRIARMQTQATNCFGPVPAIRVESPAPAGDELPGCALHFAVPRTDTARCNQFVRTKLRARAARLRCAGQSRDVPQGCQLLFGSLLLHPAQRQGSYRVTTERRAQDVPVNAPRRLSAPWLGSWR